MRTRASVTTPFQKRRHFCAGLRRRQQRITQYAATSGLLQDNYAECWRDLRKNFDPAAPDRGGPTT